MTVHRPDWYPKQYAIARNRLSDFEKKKSNKIKGAGGNKTKLATIERRHQRLITNMQLYAEFCGVEND